MAENGKVTGALLSLHAQTALHPGAGTALGTVDLPVQRERHTLWPTIAGSALKGILRDACREVVARERHQGDRKKANEEDAELVTLFGPGKPEESSAHAGALSFTDARLLAFPVRSLRGVFAWVSCPAALHRLERDAVLVGKQLPMKPPKVDDNRVALPVGQCPCLVGESHVVLEEFEFEKLEETDDKLAGWISENLLPNSDSYEATRERFQKHFLVLSDNDFTHFARHATEVAARIGLNYETKTVRTGALFYQEFLPAETLFYAVVLANPARSRTGDGKDGPGILRSLRVPALLQVGGDETTGKGLCATRLS
jgi:CRISPR-associated protein Cmr4